MRTALRITVAALLVLAGVVCLLYGLFRPSSLSNPTAITTADTPARVRTPSNGADAARSSREIKANAQHVLSVRSSQDGSPVPAATVTFKGELIGATDDDGLVSIDAMAMDPSEFAVHAPGFEQAASPILGPPANRVALTIFLDPVCNLPLIVVGQPTASKTHVTVRDENGKCRQLLLSTVPGKILLASLSIGTVYTVQAEGPEQSGELTFVAAAGSSVTLCLEYSPMYWLDTTMVQDGTALSVRVLSAKTDISMQVLAEENAQGRSRGLVPIGRFPGEDVRVVVVAEGGQTLLDETRKRPFAEGAIFVIPQWVRDVNECVSILALDEHGHAVAARCRVTSIPRSVMTVFTNGKWWLNYGPGSTGRDIVLSISMDGHLTTRVKSQVGSEEQVLMSPAPRGQLDILVHGEGEEPLEVCLSQEALNRSERIVVLALPGSTTTVDLEPGLWNMCVRTPAIHPFRPSQVFINSGRNRCSIGPFGALRLTNSSGSPIPVSVTNGDGGAPIRATVPSCGSVEFVLGVGSAWIYAGSDPLRLPVAIEIRTESVSDCDVASAPVVPSAIGALLGEVHGRVMVVSSPHIPKVTVGMWSEPHVARALGAGWLELWVEGEGGTIIIPRTTRTSEVPRSLTTHVVQIPMPMAVEQVYAFVSLGGGVSWLPNGRISRDGLSYEARLPETGELVLFGTFNSGVAFAFHSATPQCDAGFANLTKRHATITLRGTGDSPMVWRTVGGCVIPVSVALRGPLANSQMEETVISVVAFCSSKAFVGLASAPGDMTELEE